MIKCFNTYKSYPLPKEVLQSLKAYSYTFNPSYVVFNEVHYFAIRAYCNKKQSILAFLYVWDELFNVSQLNLTEFFNENLDLNKVADPKLFIMNEQVWCTFNTGYVDSGFNKIILFNLYSNFIGEFYECIYNTRIRIEKNWTFFYKDNTIHALYSLNPLTVLKVVSKSEQTLTLNLSFTDKDTCLNYSLGSPIVQLSANSYGFIGHRKLNYKEKRMYLGKAFTLKIMPSYGVIKHKPFLIHSIFSMLGSKFKFNKNLLSCTYFSSLCVVDNKHCIVGYGINDVRWELKKTQVSKLWH